MDTSTQIGYNMSRAYDVQTKISSQPQHKYKTIIN